MFQIRFCISSEHDEVGEGASQQQNNKCRQRRRAARVKPDDDDEEDSTKRYHCNGHLPVPLRGMGTSSSFLSKRKHDVQQVRVYGGQWYRCSASWVDFTHTLVPHDDWRELVTTCATQWEAKETQIIELFYKLCHAADYPYIIVRVKRRLYSLLDPTPKRVFRLLFDKAARDGAFGDPANGPLRGVVEFGKFVPWLLDVTDMDFMTLTNRLLLAAFPNLERGLTANQVINFLNHLTGKAGPADSGDALTRTFLSKLTGHSPAHHVSAFVEFLCRYPVFAHPLLRFQWTLQRKVFGIKFWMRRRLKLRATSGDVPDTALPLPCDLSLRYCRVVSARTLLLEAGCANAAPLQFGNAFNVVATSVMDPKPVVAPEPEAPPSPKAKGKKKKGKRVGRRVSNAGALSDGGEEEKKRESPRPRRKKPGNRRAMLAPRDEVPDVPDEAAFNPDEETKAADTGGFVVMGPRVVEVDGYSAPPPPTAQLLSTGAMLATLAHPEIDSAVPSLRVPVGHTRLCTKLAPPSHALFTMTPFEIVEHVYERMKETFAAATTQHQLTARTARTARSHQSAAMPFPTTDRDKFGLTGITEHVSWLHAMQYVRCLFCDGPCLEDHDGVDGDASRWGGR